MKFRIIVLIMAIAALSIPASADVASLVFSIPGGIVIPMPAANYFGPGPQTFSGVTWTSTNTANQGGSVFGYTGGYGFLDNGIWTGDLGPMAGLNDSTGTMTFTLATPVAGIGGFLNYACDEPGCTNPTHPTIAVYDASNNLLGSALLTFSTPDESAGVNQGLFMGFLAPSAEIKRFTLTDNFIGITDLTMTTTASVPEPAGVLLLVSMLFGVGLMAGLRKRV